MFDKESEYFQELNKLRAAEEAYWRRRNFLRSLHSSTTNDAYFNEVNQLSKVLLKQRHQFRERFGEIPEE
jgi:hypothetical protein